MSEGDRELAKEPELSGPGDLRLRFVVVDSDTYERYFDRVANGILWRTHHFLPDDASEPTHGERSRDDWEAFEATNRAFAEALDEATSEAVFLVQDYPLPLVPRYLRELRPDARIVHFTHTPFAGPNAWRSVSTPIREAVLRGMCAADVLGFQSRTWAKNFLATVRAHTDATVDIRAGRIALDGHIACVRTFPVSVSVDQLRSATMDPATIAIRRSLARDAIDQAMILRVDRLEPSKNILRGFEAFEQVLERYPSWRGRVRYLTLLTPSRQERDVDRGYRDACLAAAERINTRFGGEGWRPVTMRTQQDVAYTVAAYGLYDLMLANPIHDGMNLAALEGPVVNERLGVLVLSRSAGAYARLRRYALGVEPTDVAGTADAIVQGLAMGEPERVRRGRGLVRTIAGHTPSTWLADQLEALDDIRGESP
jgi:trehalose 6-phosphate synthase